MKKNQKMKKGRKHLSFLRNLILPLIIGSLLTLSANAQMDSARVERGALLELTGKIWSGAGQAGITGFDGFESYWDIAPADQKPSLFMDYYDSYNIGPEWTHELKQELLKFHRQGYYVIPQIGYNIDYFYEDIVSGAHETELNNLVKGFQYLGMPVFLRIGYEFNNQKSWSAKQYIDAFKVITQKLRDGGVEVATVYNAGLSGNTGMKSHYPGSEFVDWVGVNCFTWDISNGQHVITNQMDELATEENKPMMIGEASPTKVNQKAYDNWNEFYETYFKMIEDRPSIKQMCYINWSWDIQDVLGGNALFPWGDSRLQMPGSVKDTFFARMDREEYFFATTEEETRALFDYDDDLAPSTPSGLSRSGNYITWNAVTDNGESGLAHYTIYKDGEFWDYIGTPNYPVKDLGYGDNTNVQVLAMDRAGNASPLSTGLTVDMNDRIELIIDGEFDQPPTSWALDWQFKGMMDDSAKPAPDDITNNIKNDALLSGQNYVELTWDKDPPNPKDWKIQFFQHFQVQKDETYIISFMAKADEAMSFKLKFMDHAPWWNITHVPATQDPNFDEEWQIYDEWTVNLTTEPQTFTYVSTAPVSETARLSFMFGTSKRTPVYIDAVSVSAGNGNFVIANAGGNQTVIDYDEDGSEPVTLDGSNSRAINGTITSYVWDVEGEGTYTGAVQNLTLDRGEYNVTLTVTADDGTTDTDDIIIKVTEYVPDPQDPYADQSIPGKIEAEYYDIGADGVAYHDSDATNAGGQLRNDGVDIGSNPTAVGWTVHGEWLEYTVNVTPGTYTVNARVASDLSSAGAIKVSLQNTELANFDVPNTGGWNAWQVMSQSGVTVDQSGTAILRVDISGGNLNLDWIEFVAEEAAQGNTTKSATSVSSDNQVKRILYPNPVQNTLTVSGVDEGAKYKVYDASGNIVAEGTGNKVNVSDLAKGMYIIEIDSKRTVFVKQ